VTSVPIRLAGWQFDSSPSDFAVGDTVDWVLGYDLTCGPQPDGTDWTITLPVTGRHQTEQGPLDTETVLASDGALNVYVCVPATLHPAEVTIGAPENDRHERTAPPQARSTRFRIESIEMVSYDGSRRDPDGRLTTTLPPTAVRSSTDVRRAAGPYLQGLLLRCIVRPAAE
jgi:hypothetical protein